MAQTDSNVIERLKRAVYPTDPTNPDGDWNVRTAGSAGGTSTTDNTNFTPGASSITPVGGYFGGRQVGSGHIAAVAVNGSGVLQVDMISGGANSGFATVGVYGSVSVLGTVNLGSIPTINLGLGTVNVGNVVTVTLGKVPTMFAIKATAGGVTLIASGLYPLSVYGIKLITDATVDVYLQSASGNAIEGTMRLLPGAGFAENNQIGSPLYYAPSGLFIALSVSANVGGIARVY